MKIRHWASIILVALAPSIVEARSTYNGYKIIRVHDQRPQANQLDIHITPQKHDCSVISFIVGEAGLTDEHLKSIQSTALAALMGNKSVGGLWDDPADGCKGTNLFINSE